MALWKTLRLLVLMFTSTAVAQIFANGPFQLHISSLTNASINGHAYPCIDTLGLCYQEGGLTGRSTGTGFVFTSYGQADYTSGYLSYRNNNKNATNNTVTAYGPVGLIYDPGTNVAIPIFNQTNTPETLGFDSETGNLLMEGIDDTVTSSNSSSSNSTAGEEDGGHDRSYNNWHLCLVLLNQYNEVLVSWVLGANLGWPPTNPTCQPINITMEVSAVGYGG